MTLLPSFGYGDKKRRLSLSFKGNNASTSNSTSSNPKESASTSTSVPAGSSGSSPIDSGAMHHKDVPDNASASSSSTSAPTSPQTSTSGTSSSNTSPTATTHTPLHNAELAATAVSAGLPQISRWGRVVPSTQELEEATLQCLAYGTPRPVVASEDFVAPPAYDAPARR